jgi:hypothetical protein
VPLELLLDVWVADDELEPEPELNEDREDDEEPLVEARRTASIAFGLGFGRPSVRLGPKYAGP